MVGSPIPNAPHTTAPTAEPPSASGPFCVRSLAENSAPIKGREAGFAAVDALTALAILATTITLSIVALSAARRAEQLASQTGAARTTIQFLLAEPARPAGLYSGSNPDFHWTVQVDQEAGTASPVQLCAQMISLRSRTGGKIYTAQSRRPCPPNLPQP